MILSKLAEEVWVHFNELIQRESLLRSGQRVVAGVSGGADSLALLHLLLRWRASQDPSVCLIVAHLNHCIRPAADGDADFVANLADQVGLECVLGWEDVPTLAQEPGLSLEEAARLARYRFLLSTARAWNARVVAVGHNADDQVESVVMHWLRGSGLAGLRGMLPVSSLTDLRLGTSAPSAGDDEVLLIRPLLECPRRMIEAYCQVHSLCPRQDHSNLDTTFFRNRLRHELIPLLENYNQNIRGVIQRSARVIATDYDYLRQQMLATWTTLVHEPQAGVFQIPLGTWRELHPSMQAGILREAVRRLRWSLRNINWVHIDNARRVTHEGRVGARATLPQRLMLTLGYECFWIADEGWQPSQCDVLQVAGEMTLPVPGQLDLGKGWHIETDVVDVQALDGIWLENTDPWRAFLDADRLPLNRLRLRRRRPGDRIQPLGMGGKRMDVRQLMIAARVPKAERSAYPLLVTDEDIIWVPGVRLDERTRITPQTRRVLVVSLTRKGPPAK